MKAIVVKTLRQAFHRDKLVFGIAFVIFVLAVFYKLSPSKIYNYTDVMSASLSFSSIATAFLFAVFSIIPGKTSSEILVKLRDMNTDLKLMSRLLIATIAFFLSSILSFAELFFPVTASSWLSIFSTGLWISSICLGIIETLLLLAFLFIVLGSMFQER